MSEASSAGDPRPSSASDWRLIAFLSGFGLLLLALTVLADGNLGAILAPFAGFGVLVLIWRIPLRYTALALLFLGCTMEAPYEAFASYEWRTPLYPLGYTLLGNLNIITGFKPLRFTGTDALLAYLLVVVAYRRATRSTIDGQGFVPIARPMIWACLFSVGTALLQLLHGLARGGDFSNSLWQLHMLVLIPPLVLVLQAAFRGSRDLKALGAVYLCAGVVRALLAVYIMQTVRVGGEQLPYATTHADSMLFAAVLSLTLVLYNERTQLGRSWLNLLIAATLVAGMVSNSRRLVWVSVIGCMLASQLISPWTPLKRRLVRAMMVLSPLIFAYLSAGWSSDAAVFKPVAMVRSVVDSKSDSSSKWRDMENDNLVKNIHLTPLLGTGFGHEYIEYEQLPDVSGAYPQYRYIPHNSVLATVAFSGMIGFTAQWTMLVVCVFLAVRTYHRAAAPRVRAAALACVVVVIAYMNQVYGDIGVSAWIGLFLLAPAMTMAGKLAVETGAWPGPGRRPAPGQPLSRPVISVVVDSAPIPPPGP